MASDLKSVHKLLDQLNPLTRWNPDFPEREKQLAKAILFHKAAEVKPHRAWAFSHEQCLAVEEDYTEERNRETRYKRRRLEASESLLPIRQGRGRMKKERMKGT